LLPRVLVNCFKITLMDNPSFTKARVNQVRDVVEENFPKTLDSLTELVKIPGIAWEAFDQSQLDKSAQAVCNLFKELELFDFLEVVSSKDDSGKSGAQAVLGSREPKNGKPTVLLYAHHDVQPPGELKLWKSSPFEPAVREGRLYGRGAADDKAGIMAHWNALATLKRIAGEDFDLGIALFIEGEEEAGSPTFANFLVEFKEKLQADVIVVADSSNWTTEIPAITTTLRGLVSLELEIRTLDHALHSGMFGGVAPDAMLALVKLLGSFWDEKGNLTINGLKESKNPEIDYSEEQFRADSGVLPSTLLAGDGSLASRLWAKPALTLIGLDYPSVEVSSNTLLPSVKAKLSLRIAPGDDPERALEALKAHILANNHFGAEISFGAVELGSPFEAKSSGWAKRVMQEALSSSFGNDCVDIGIGGSIPFIAELERVFPLAEVLVTGVEDPDSRAHSPNESLDLAGFKNALVAESLLLLSGNDLNAKSV
jgi:cysteinylglycine-S-conjugate dipeptidase